MKITFKPLLYIMQIISWTRRSWRTTRALELASKEWCLFICPNKEKVEQTRELAKSLWLYVDIVALWDVTEEQYDKMKVIDDAREVELDLETAISLMPRIVWVVIEINPIKLKDLI